MAMVMVMVMKHGTNHVMKRFLQIGYTLIVNFSCRYNQSLKGTMTKLCLKLLGARIVSTDVAFCSSCNFLSFKPQRILGWPARSVPERLFKKFEKLSYSIVFSEFSSPEA